MQTVALRFPTAQARDAWVADNAVDELDTVRIVGSKMLGQLDGRDPLDVWPPGSLASARRSVRGDSAVLIVQSAAAVASALAAGAVEIALPTPADGD